MKQCCTIYDVGAIRNKNLITKVLCESQFSHSCTYKAEGEYDSWDKVSARGTRKPVANILRQTAWETWFCNAVYMRDHAYILGHIVQGTALLA